MATRNEKINEYVNSAWARASIHLNLGQLDEAARIGSEVLDTKGAMKTMTPPTGAGLAMIVGHRHVPNGWAFHAPEHGLMVVSHQVWDAHIMHCAIHDFATQTRDLAKATWQAYDRQSWIMQDELERGFPFSDEHDLR